MIHEDVWKKIRILAIAENKEIGELVEVFNERLARSYHLIQKQLSFLETQPIPIPSNTITTPTNTISDQKQQHMEDTVIQKLPWGKFKDKRVKLADNEDIGEVENIDESFVRIRGNSPLKKTYFIPRQFFHRFDKDNLYTSLSKKEFEMRSMIARKQIKEKGYPKDIDELEKT